ncbi:MAG: site-2 protease family protein, partial [Gemmataceae bacterium]|nr:site-2 protease family protein [Gemmataceae bacterium]
VRVLRQGAVIELVDVPVDRQGRIGFTAATSAEVLPLVGSWPAPNRYKPVGDVFGAGGEPVPVGAPSGAGLGIPAGSRISAVGGTSTRTLLEVRDALRAAAIAASPGPLPVRIAVTPPSPGGAGAAEPVIYEVNWVLSGDEAAKLRELTWASPVEAYLFKPEQTLLKSDDPLSALGRGVHETHRVMLQTYLTFARLFQGSVKVEHLKGPVGIAHTGTILVERGFIWLLFFMGVISINLAVINFLPLPIVDGGHFVFLLYEQFTGKPVSAGVQGVTTMVGLVLIGTMFLVVTYNDLANLLWR